MKQIGLIALLASFLGGFWTQASAQTAWRTMHANTYDATPASARAQCLRELSLGHVPGLSAQKCALLERKLETGDFEESRSQIGQNYHSVAGVGRDKVQQLNFEPRALLVNLGDGVVVHWFTGEDRSCNNIGFVKPRVCRVVQGPSTYRGDQFFSSPGLHVHTEYCGHDLTIDLPGTMTMLPGYEIGSSTLVCE